MDAPGSYRVLDLTDEQGMFCAGLVAGMGAEVVRIQKPGEEVPQVYANSGKHCLSLNIENARVRGCLEVLVEMPNHPAYRKVDFISELYGNARISA